MHKTMPDPYVSIQLSAAEALVLEEFLARWQRKDVLDVVDSAEKYVLYKIHNILEQTLDDLYDPHYDEVLQQRRAEVLMNWEAGSGS
jgi:hypothetical protein